MEEQDLESTTSQDLAKDLEMDNDDINKSYEQTALKAPTARHTSNSINKHEMEESKAEGNIENQPEKKPHTEGSDLYLPEGNSNKNLLQEDNVHTNPKNYSVTELEENEVYNPKKAEEQERDNVHDKEEDIVQELNEDSLEKGASGISEENWHPLSYTDKKDSEAVLQQEFKEFKEGKEDEKDEEEKRLMDEKVQRRSQSKENNRKPENVGHWKHKSGRPRPGLDRPYGGHERQSHDRKDKERRQHAQNNWVEYKPGERNSAAQNAREKTKDDRKHKNEEKKYWDSGLPDERDKYEYFWGNRFVFSQWYPCKFEVDGKTYNCAEQYMMHQKAVLMDDMERAEIIMALDEPREMKQQGRYVENFDKKIWDKCCQDVVEKGNMAKFSQNEELKERLLRTFPRTLVEASPMDRIWGIGLAKEDHRAWNKQTWRGRNLLGEVLTRVRDNLMEEDHGEIGRKEGKGPVKGTVNKGEQEVGRQGGKGPVKEKTDKEAQEGRMGKGGSVKKTVNEGEQEVGRKGGRTGKKSPVKGRDSENYKSTPV